MERDEQLIRAVSSYPCLYNRSLAEFRVQERRDEAWTSIAQAVGESGECASKAKKLSHFGITSNELARLTVSLTTSILWQVMLAHCKCTPTVIDCQKRWRTLREKFVREMKKPMKFGERGWDLMPHMEFLREFVKQRR